MVVLKQHPGENDDAYAARIIREVEELPTDADGAKTLTLNWPKTLTFHTPGQGTREELLTEVRIRRPTGKEMRTVDVRKPEVSLVLDRVEALTGLVSKHVDLLDESDLQRIMAVIQNFT